MCPPTRTAMRTPRGIPCRMRRRTATTATGTMAVMAGGAATTVTGLTVTAITVVMVTTAATVTMGGTTATVDITIIDRCQLHTGKGNARQVSSTCRAFVYDDHYKNERHTHHGTVGGGGDVPKGVAPPTGGGACS